MKKTNIIIGAVVVVIIIVVIILLAGRHSTSSPSSPGGTATNNTPTVSVPATETTIVSSSVVKYENAELGFSVEYPRAWSTVSNPTGPTFIIPNPSASSTTISALQGTIYTAPGKCTFPPVAPSSIKENTTVKAGAFTFNMISAATTTEGTTHFNRMYTLPQGSGSGAFCYYFSFGAVSVSTKNAALTAANQSRIQAADNAFTAIVKSFALVQGPTGDSETAHPAGK